MLPVLAQPLVAAVLGLVLGVGLVFVSRASARFMTPEDPQLGLARVAVAMLLRLAVVVMLLAAFYFWARPGLAPFGIALIVGFMGALTYELFTVGRPARSVGTQGGR